MTTPRPSDAALLAAADPDAFRELYARYAERVFGYFVRRSGDHDAAFDLTAETFAQAWIVRRRFRDEAAGSAAPWLFGIARNVLLMSVRRGRLERRAVERLGVAERLDDPYEPATAAPDERWAEDADELLAALPETQRQAVRLRVVDQLEYDEVALAAALAALAIVVPGAALAANALISNDDVAKRIPSGTWALMGTQPTCTAVRPDVEFDCRLAKPPRTGDIPPGEWAGTVEPTVDRTKHVNGGCRSLSADGKHWRCYIGREAVRQDIIGPGFLGAYAPAPGRG